MLAVKKANSNFANCVGSSKRKSEGETTAN
jgi:hypothetical protein